MGEDVEETVNAIQEIVVEFGLLRNVVNAARIEIAQQDKIASKFIFKPDLPMYKIRELLFKILHSKLLCKNLI